MQKKPNILFVTTALLAPPHAGCMLRTANVARQLAKCGRVTILVVGDRFDPDSWQLLKGEFPDCHRVTLRSWQSLPQPWGELRRKWDMHWPFSKGIGADAAGQTLFDELARNNDLIWFHTLAAAQPFNSVPYDRSIMDLDDLNWCKYDQSAKQQPTVRFRMSARVQSIKWWILERGSMRCYRTVVVCSRVDKAFLGGSENIQIVPNGFAAPAVKPSWQTPDPNRVGFIGTLGYGPNAEGLRWFRDKVWPQILKQRPQMKLRIIGKPAPEKYQIPANGFEYLGYVDDPRPEMQTWSAMIVPILFAGGTRIKILDAFSKLCPIISTSIGAYGIDVTHEKDILLADTPADFAAACLRLSTDPQLAFSLADAGWQLFSERYTWDVIGRNIENIVNDRGQNPAEDKWN
ncbi:MAG: glycosyltransferase family 4 protein [Planctomycetaceae bacterium]|nr:glycosyltransferase family 4 protein [Planctomycetaceae bacterium]